MGDVERIIGRLEEHKEQTNQRLDTIEKKIDILHQFKWRVAGGAGALSVIVALGVEAFKVWAERSN